MKTKPQLTRRYLLTQVKKLILQEPKRMRMEKLLNKTSGKNAPPCKTVGCIAGWTCVVAHSLSRALVISWPLDTAHRLLKLRPSEHAPLFYLDSWPVDLKSAYKKSKTPLGRARVTARRIDLFLKSGGRK